MKKIIQWASALAGLFVFSGLASASFSDVPADHPYFEAIDALQKQGVIEGYEDGTYDPDGYINRVAALKIILLGSDIAVPELKGGEDLFADVSGDTWYAKYVYEAKKRGIVSGDADTGLLRPGDFIIKAEILKILLETNERQVSMPTSHPYADVAPGTWHAPYFDYARKIKLFPESGSQDIRPGESITRGLMADLMYQLTYKKEGYQEGKASYYGNELLGNGTASGERFDPNALTAAHPNLPFGTEVLVTNLANGKQVTVRINDRGPFSGNRIIDLSRAAFAAISPLSTGVIEVSLVPLAPVDQLKPAAPTCSDKQNLYYLPQESFKDIHLDQAVPSVFLESQVLQLSGFSTHRDENVTAFVMDDTSKQYPFYTQKGEGGHFELSVFFPKPGRYQLGILPGESGSTNVYEILVLEQKCFDFTGDEALDPLSNLVLELDQGNLRLSWEDAHDYELAKVRFSQGSRVVEYIVSGTDELIPHYPDFEGWSAGPVKVEVAGANLTTSALMEADSVVWGPSVSTTFEGQMHHDYIVKTDKVDAKPLPQTLIPNQNFNLQFDPLTNVSDEGLVILPSGFVESVPLTSPSHNSIQNTNGVSIFPASATQVNMAYTPTQNGLYFFEVNDDGGQAVINIPLYPAGHFPLLPNPVDLTGLEPVVLQNDLATLQRQMLDLVNQDRVSHGLAPVQLDDNLSQLAQARTDDMAENKYFSHWNLEGFNANHLRKDYGIVQFVAENIARDASIPLVQYGFMRSASHRDTILDPEWKRVGFGITDHAQQGYLFAQIFSDDPLDFSNTDERRQDILEALNASRDQKLTLNSALNELAQGWSDDMVKEGFFDAVNPDGAHFVDEVRAAGFDMTMGSYLVGNSSFESALNKITSNLQLQESRWREIGIGVAQDASGVLKITLSYIE